MDKQKAKTDIEIIEVVEKHFSDKKLLTTEEYEKLHFVFMFIKITMPVCITIRYIWIVVKYLVKNTKELLILGGAGVIIWNWVSGNFANLLAYFVQKGAE